MLKDYDILANDLALEQRNKIQLGSNTAIIIVKTILGDYCKKSYNVKAKLKLKSVGHFFSRI